MLQIKYLGSSLLVVAFLNAGITVAAQTPGLSSSAMIERNAGETTVRAVRLVQPLQLDGQLTEQIYKDVPSISGLIQVEPEEGAAPSERTEVWIMFDDNNVYFSARCWEEAPEGRTIANEMRRDSFNIPQNEHIGFTFDTFHDRRNAYMWIINPLGGRMDGQITDESVYNPDWNPVYDLEGLSKAGHLRLSFRLNPSVTVLAGNKSGVSCLGVKSAGETKLPFSLVSHK